MKPMYQLLYIPLVGLATATFAQPLADLNQKEVDIDQVQSSEQNQERGHALINPKPSSEIVGMDILSGDDKVGEVDEIFINLESGKVLALVVSTGGILDPEAQQSLISPKGVRFDSGEGNLVSSLSKEQIQSAPRYRKGDTSPGKNLGVSELVGMNIEGRDGDSIGSIEKVHIDLESGQVMAVISTNSGFLGLGSRKCVLSMKALDYNAEKKTLSAKFDREQLRGTPEYKADDPSLFTSMARQMENSATGAYIGTEPVKN